MALVSNTCTPAYSVHMYLLSIYYTKMIHVCTYRVLPRQILRQSGWAWLWPHQLISFHIKVELIVKTEWATLPKGPGENTDTHTQTIPSPHTLMHMHVQTSNNMMVLLLLRYVAHMLNGNDSIIYQVRFCPFDATLCVVRTAGFSLR